MSERTPDPEETVRFFESTDFDEPTKDRAAEVSHQINALLHRHCQWCKDNGVSKQVWMDSERLALATCLKTRMDISP